MANPPITIGPFANVPAPGSPIKSDWAQDITNGLVSMLQLVGFGKAGTLSGVGTTVTDVPGTTIAFTGVNGAWYASIGYLRATTTNNGQRCTAQIVNSGGGLASRLFDDNAIAITGGTSGLMGTGFEVVQSSGASITRKITLGLGSGTTGTCAVVDGALMVLRLGLNMQIPAALAAEMIPDVAVDLIPHLVEGE